MRKHVPRLFIVLTSVFEVLLFSFLLFATYMGMIFGGPLGPKATQTDLIEILCLLVIFCAFLIVSLLPLKNKQLLGNILMIKSIFYLYYFVTLWWSFVSAPMSLEFVFIPIIISVYLFFSAGLLIHYWKGRFSRGEFSTQR